MDNCSITRSRAERLVGALYVGGSATISNSSITEGYAGFQIGAVWVGPSGSATMTGCSFTNSSAGQRVGLLAIGSLAAATMIDCAFRNQSSSCVGMTTNIGCATFIGCTIADTLARFYTGTIFNGPTSILAMSSCVVTDSRALVGSVGGIFICVGSSGTLSNCTFVRCSSPFGAALVGQNGFEHSRDIACWLSTDTTRIPLRTVAVPRWIGDCDRLYIPILDRILYRRPSLYEWRSTRGFRLHLRRCAC